MYTFKLEIDYCMVELPAQTETGAMFFNEMSYCSCHFGGHKSKQTNLLSMSNAMGHKRVSAALFTGWHGTLFSQHTLLQPQSVN